MDAVLLGSDRTLEARIPSLLLPQGSLSISSRTRLGFPGPHAAFLRHITKKHKNFPGICDATGGKAATPPIPGLSFQRNSMLLYSLSKSAANAALKLMSAVIAIAHVLFVSIKSLSVNITLPVNIRLKNDSTTLPMSGFLGSSPVSASRSSVSLAILKFFKIIFFQFG